MNRIFGGKLLPGNCSRCGGNVYEDESFMSDGKRYVEIVCLHCSRYRFMEVREYTKWLKRMGWI
jgi:DNA-directed RNA polymerase subunit RPC12/RpoP